MIAGRQRVEPAAWQAFDTLDPPRHVVAQVLGGPVGENLAQVRRRHAPALGAGPLFLVGYQIYQVLLADFIDVHKAKHASV